MVEDASWRMEGKTEEEEGKMDELQSGQKRGEIELDVLLVRESKSATDTQLGVQLLAVARASIHTDKLFEASIQCLMLHAPP